MSSASGPARLARALEFRWRIRLAVRIAVPALLISLTASLAAAIIHVAASRSLPVFALLLLMNGAAVAAALFLAAIRRRTAQALLADADRTFNTHALLSSAFEFAQEDPRTLSPTEQLFREAVVAQAEELTPRIDPAAVFPVEAPPRTAVVAGLAVATAVVLLLGAAGLFGRTELFLAEEGFLLEDAGRRLAERTDQDELRDLAEEVRRLGERLRGGEIGPDEARRLIDQLAEEVEEQLRNLERLGEFETNQDMEIPPQAEESIRSALSSGMSEGEVMELFMRMRSEGQTMPDMIEALEEAIPDQPPDANLALDEEELRRLLEQLNRRPGGEAESDITTDLSNTRRSLQQAGRGLTELTEGDDREIGQAGETGTGRGRGREEREPLPGEGDDSNLPGTEGSEGGDEAVKDAMTDAFARIEDASPVFREIQGVIGKGTIRDVIVRELPSEAVSRLTEEERAVAFERVIEEAVSRENTPAPLQRLVRNYFLRITLGEQEGDNDDQQ